MINALETAIRSTLTSGTALTALLAGTAAVYSNAIPMDAAYPLVIMRFNSGRDENDNPARRITFQYQVKGISKTSMTNAGLIDNAIDALLHNKSISVAGYSNIWLMRINGIRYVDQTENRQIYYHAGGIYEITLAET